MCSNSSARQNKVTPVNVVFSRLSVNYRPCHGRIPSLNKAYELNGEVFLGGGGGGRGVKREEGEFPKSIQSVTWDVQ